MIPLNRSAALPTLSALLPTLGGTIVHITAKSPVERYTWECTVDTMRLLFNSLFTGLYSPLGLWTVGASAFYPASS